MMSKFHHNTKTMKSIVNNLTQKCYQNCHIHSHDPYFGNKSVYISHLHPGIIHLHCCFISIFTPASSQIYPNASSRSKSSSQPTQLDFTPERKSPIYALVECLQHCYIRHCSLSEVHLTFTKTSVAVYCHKINSALHNLFSKFFLLQTDAKENCF